MHASVCFYSLSSDLQLLVCFRHVHVFVSQIMSEVFHPDLLCSLSCVWGHEDDSVEYFILSNRVYYFFQQIFPLVLFIYIQNSTVDVNAVLGVCVVLILLGVALWIIDATGLALYELYFTWSGIITGAWVSVSILLYSTYINRPIGY